MYFATAGIEISPFTPVLAAFFISLICSMGGVSGAFLLLPFQISVLGYTSPGVSATNHIFNVVACPAGVWRYAREGRLLLPLTLCVIAGTLPGVFLGAVVRVTWLAELQKFMIFVALVLLYIGGRMCLQVVRSKRTVPRHNKCEILSATLGGFSFRFDDEVYHVRNMSLLALSFAVGLIGGVYGIGGGAIMSPFLTALFKLPVYAIAGATLLATFMTSLAGVAFFSIFSLLGHAESSPDWGLGFLFGIGGIFGMYCGATLQKRIPPGVLRMSLLAIIMLMGLNYLFKGLGL